MLSRSPGARGRIALRLATGLLVAGTLQVAADGLTDARTAFTERDYARAWDLWQTEARAGSTEAQNALGLMYDAGLGVSRDTDRAFAWYLSAARRGHPSAQLNVGIMADSGIGMPADAAVAAHWYARAAANGEARGAYNLGLLYASGAGVPHNRELAKAWLSSVADAVPAARDRISGILPVVRPAATSPVPQSATRRTGADGVAHAEFVWTTDSMGPGTTFRVEMRADDSPPQVIAERIAVSALSTAVPDGIPSTAEWRVVQIPDGMRNETASAWVPFDTSDPFTPIRPLVRIAYSEAVPIAADLAADLSETLSAADARVILQPIPPHGDGSSISYAFGEDRPFAEAIQTLLPAGTPITSNPGASDLAPGEITVKIGFGERRGHAQTAAR